MRRRGQEQFFVPAVVELPLVRASFLPPNGRHAVERHSLARVDNAIAGGEFNLDFGWGTDTSGGGGATGYGGPLQLFQPGYLSGGEFGGGEDGPSRSRSR